MTPVVIEPTPLKTFGTRDTTPKLTLVDRTATAASSIDTSSLSFISCKSITIAKGMYNSRVFRLLSLGLAIGLTASCPPLLAIAIALMLAHLYLITVDKSNWDKFKIEISAINRRLFRPTCNLMDEHKNGARLFLGHNPNRFGNDLENFIRDNPNNNGHSILSINQGWEKERRGGSIPYTAQDRKKLGITPEHYEEIDSKDHLALDTHKLRKAVAFIRKELEDGRDVYVHCVAGSGRSATAVAA